MEEKRVRVGVAVNVLKDDQYLLLRRKSPLGTDTWCAPGGKMEWGEDIYTTAMRELREEVGENIQISDPCFYCITNDIFEKEQEHYITINVIADYISGEPVINEPEKFSDIGWFHQEDLDEMDLFLPTRNFLFDEFITGDCINPEKEKEL